MSTKAAQAAAAQAAPEQAPLTVMAPMAATVSFRVSLESPLITEAAEVAGVVELEKPMPSLVAQAGWAAAEMEEQMELALLLEPSTLEAAVAVRDTFLLPFQARLEAPAL